MAEIQVTQLKPLLELAATGAVYVTQLLPLLEIDSTGLRVTQCAPLLEIDSAGVQVSQCCPLIELDPVPVTGPGKPTPTGRPRQPTRPPPTPPRLPSLPARPPVQPPSQPADQTTTFSLRQPSSAAPVPGPNILDIAAARVARDLARDRISGTFAPAQASLPAAIAGPGLARVNGSFAPTNSSDDAFTASTMPVVNAGRQAMAIWQPATKSSATVVANTSAPSAPSSTAGANADTLDGLHASDLAEAAHTHVGTDITSQVADADTVDGSHANAFAAAGHDHAGVYAPVAHTHGGEDITSQVADADTIDGSHASDFAAAAHDHAGVYAPTAHTHSGEDITSQVADADTVDGSHAADFAAAGHDHAGVYAPTAHTHTGEDITSQVADADTVDGSHAADFAAAGHDHTGVYAPTTHTHDAPTAHTHAGTDITSQVADADTVDGSHASAFAAAGHDHAGVYAPTDHTHAFNELSDVEAEIVHVGQLLNFTGAAWAPRNLPLLEELADVSSATPADGDVLTWDANNAVWQPAAGAVGGGNVATDPIFDAKGDLPVGSGANTAVRLPVGANGSQLQANSATASGLEWVAVSKLITLGITGPLVVGGGNLRFYVPYACTITNVRASVGTAPTGASLIIDLHKGGTTLFSTQANRPTITAGSYTDLTSTPDVTAIAKDDYLQLYCDQVGATTPGSDLHVQIEVTVP